MDKYEFVRLMEQKKEERITNSERYEKRDIFFELIKEAEEFKTERNNAIFIFYGLRGIGKSTTINQALKETNGMLIDGTVLSYYGLNFVDTVREYLQYNKTKILFVDEITDIAGWGKALKVIYDNFGVKIIATGSSAVQITRDRNEILRRTRFKEIPPLTFREFMRIKYKKDIKVSSREIFLAAPADAYVKAKATAMEIPELIVEYRDYLRNGFPLAFEMPIEEVAESILSKIIVDDFPGVSGFNMDVTLKARNIINTLSLSKPDAVALSKFSEVANCSKTSASNILNAFVVASLLMPVSSNNKGVAKLRKEPKYLFSSSALRYGLAKRLVNEVEIGSLREDAVVSAFRYAGFTIEYFSGLKKRPDYQIRFDKSVNTIEIGGPSKSLDQLKKGILIVDDNALDYSKEVVTLPAYLTGFL